MPISDAQFVAWLSQEHADRVILYEQDYTYESAGIPLQGTLFLSDKVYTRNATNVAGLTPYVECIASVPEFSRSLTGNRLNTYASSIGSVEIHNNDGELDFFLDLAIDGNSARFYYGDASWDRSDFRLIFSVLGQCVRRAPFRRLSIDLKDSSLFLNRSIGGESLVGGVGPFANNARPLNFGFVHNITPLSYDSVNLVYTHSDITSGDAVAVEVRDDGVPVSFTDNGNGRFTLASTPVGLITCDVEAYPLADTSGANANVSDAFDEIIAGRGDMGDFGLYLGPHPTFVEGDVDDYPLGIHVQDARNVLELLAEITDSGNCFSAIRRDNLFTFGRLKPYDIESFGLEPVDIVEDDIVPANGFEIEHLLPEYYRFQAYAHKNWTVQSNLSDLLNADEKARFERKGQYALQSLLGGSTYILSPEQYHKTLTTSPPVETLLSWEDDSSILYLTQWMETRRAMTLPWLEVASVSLPLGANPDAPAMFYELELGDVTRVTLARFGFDAGTLFQVISIGINLSRARVSLRMVRKRGASAPPVGWESSEQYIIQSALQYRRGRPTIEVASTSPPIGVPGGSSGPVIIFGGVSGGGGSEPPPEPEDDFYYLDLFTPDGATDDLSLHSPDIGTAYANDLDYPNRSTLVCIARADLSANVARGSALGANPAYGVQPVTTDSDDYVFHSVFTWQHSNEGYIQQNAYFMARKTADTHYEVTIECGAGITNNDYATVTLRRIVNGVSAGTPDFDNDVSLLPDIRHDFRFKIEGSDLKVWIDGALILDTDDSGGITSGTEVGFGNENMGGSEGFELVHFHWAACYGLDTVEAQYKLFDLDEFATANTLSIGPDVSGMRTIEYPSGAGNITIDLRIIGLDPAATYTVGWSGGTFTGVTFQNPNSADARIAFGTFVGTAEPTPVVITVSKDAVAMLPEIQLVPV